MNVFVFQKGFRAVFLVLLINLAFITVRHFFRRLPEAAPLRAIGYACDEGYCGGWADRQKGIVNAFVIAAILGQKFKVHMPQPCELGFFLSPGGAVDWRLEPGELIGRDVNRMIILNSPKALAFAEGCVCVCACVLYCMYCIAPRMGRRTVGKSSCFC